MWSAEWKIKECGWVEWLPSSPYSFIIFISPLISSSTLFFKVTLKQEEQTIWFFKGTNIANGWGRHTDEITATLLNSGAVECFDMNHIQLVISFFEARRCAQTGSKINICLALFLQILSLEQTANLATVQNLVAVSNTVTECGLHRHYKGMWIVRLHEALCLFL